MATFVYKGIVKGGREVTGEIEAKNKNEARNLLVRKGIRVIELKRAPINISLFGGGVSITDIARFTRQFAVMFASGLQITQCIEILAVQTPNPVLRKALKQVYNDIQGGNNLADSLAKHPKIFNNLYVSMVAAGEAGGILEDVLNRLADYLEAQERLIRKVKGAMMYPIVITIVAILAIIAMLKFVVPTFAKLFQEAGAPLPLPTRIVMGLADFISNNFLLIIGGFIGIGVALKWWFSTEKGKYTIDKLLITMPIFGEISTKSIIARFSRTLGTLLHSGVDIINALRVTAKTTGNKIFEETINRIIMKVTGGENISDPLSKEPIFPPMVVQMISVGEKTGNLDGMLMKIADFYEEEVNAAVESLTSLIEPLVIVFMGTIIGGILIAMYLPMFDLFQHIG